MEQGELLMQGQFSVWVENKKDRLRELRLKPMQRQIFLYEKSALFCKRVGRDPETATYQFKMFLQVNWLLLLKFEKIKFVLSISDVPNRFD